MPAVASPFLASGRLICQKVRKKLQPSIEAASTTSEGMLFWKYYKNKTTDAVIWGTGLYRYLDDAVAVKILKDIVRIKAETDPTEAKALLHHYMTVNKITEGED